MGSQWQLGRLLGGTQGHLLGRTVRFAFSSLVPLLPALEAGGEASLSGCSAALLALPSSRGRIFTTHALGDTYFGLG